MANSFRFKLGRKNLAFTDHALDQWWERCKQNSVKGRKAALALLADRLAEAQWTHSLPAWAHLKQWHIARAEGFVWIDEESGFVVNKEPGGDRVCVTFLQRYRNREAA
jgi:hypothetical protein